MASKKHFVTIPRPVARTIIEKPMVGPESGGIQFCMACHGSILRGEHWRKIYAPDGSYAVGVHDRCQVAQP